MKLLLVEDTATDAEFLAASMRRQRATDVQLTTATTLAAAVEFLGAETFDVVLLDLNLPDGSGLECVDVIQQACSDVPIVALSGHDDEEFAISILTKGVQDYLVKWEGQGRTILRSIRYAIERKRTELRLNFLAQYDSLTGIPNRQFFSDQLGRATARARRDAKKVALLYLDLDGFKAINDTMGHHAGDELLKAVAERLKKAVRAGDVVARLGGDEFAVLLEGLPGPLEVEVVATAILGMVSKPYEIKGRQLDVTASIGITMYPNDDMDTQVLLKSADIAMYRAKDSGRNNFKFFTPSMHDEVLGYHEMERDLRDALERNEFRLVFQPKVNIYQNKRLEGFEALLRWRSPSRGEVSPGEFIPVAEESGHIVPIGFWVLDEACRTMKAWRDQGLALVPVSVNVSARQFQLADFHRRVADILQRHDIDPALIEIEITEGLVMEDIGAAQRSLQKLKDLGLGISVDDFGTGYSCLAYLHSFPLDTLKIDRSFVKRIGEAEGSEIVIDAIISLARSLHLKTVAEGVETEAQSTYLLAHGCHVVQGFLYARPMPATDVAPLLAVLPPDAKRSASAANPVALQA
jgi:diguanylate cyclase (GGDEF)-like protein